MLEREVDPPAPDMRVNSEVKAQAARLAGTIPLARLAPDLERVLADPGESDTVRIAAAAALEQVDPAVAVGSLVPLLAEETGPIALRRAAALVPSIFGETLSEEELHDLVRYLLTQT